MVLSIDRDFTSFSEQLDRLIQGNATDQGFASILDQAGNLIENIEAIKSGTLESFDLASESGALGSQLAMLRTRLDGIIVPAIDDQLFYTLTGYHTLGEPPDQRTEHFSGGGVRALPSPGLAPGGGQHRDGAAGELLRGFRALAD